MRLHQIRDAKACVRDTGDRLIQVWRQQNNNTYYPGAVYSYDGEGKRIRSDQYAFGTNTIQGWREYSYFNGQMLAEHDNTGAWTDYVYANGKKIARASAQETVLQMSGTYSGGWSATGYTVGAPSMQGYVFRTGDVLLVRQRKYGSNVHGGILIFGDGTGSYFYDQDGQRADDDLLGDGVWHNRRIPLDGLQGKTYTSLSMGGGFSTDYTFQFASVAVMSADGSVRTIFNGEAEALTSSGGPPNGAGTMAAVPADANSTHYYVGDQVGTTQMELSAAGAPLWKGEFGPFGQELDLQATTNRYKFTGEERDSESGLDYFGARYYTSGAGRWMSPDWSDKPEAIPYAHLANPQTLNLYSYALNNPVSSVDPDGHDFESASGGAGSSRDCTGTNSGFLVCHGLGDWEKNLKDQNQPSAQQQSAPTTLTDKSGNTVQGANGKPALVPGGFDVNAVVQAGKDDKYMRSVAPMVGSADTSSDLANFRTGGKWDLQRLSGNFDPRFIDSATILIGMYAAAAGVTRDQILSIQSDFAAAAHVIHGYPKGTPMDPTYTHLPVRNVTNTDIGMGLIQ